MLNVTDDAATLVCTLTHDHNKSAGTAGLRIVVDPVHQSLAMSVAYGPSPADCVVVNGDARVFLAPTASRRLDKRTLRAEISSYRSCFYLDR